MLLRSCLLRYFQPLCFIVVAVTVVSNVITRGPGIGKAVIKGAAFVPSGNGG